MSTITQRWGALSGVFGFTGVVLGAFATHALSGKLSPHSLEIFHTATHYQLIHAVALIAVIRNQGKWTHRTCCFWSLGILIFSGSLYALALTDIKILGAITPIGGVFFLLGWISVAIGALRE